MSETKYEFDAVPREAPDDDTLLFFAGHGEALGLYLSLEELLRSSFPHVDKRVQKTQITFYNSRVFACVSFARVRRKAELPGRWLTLTLGLPAPLESPRVAAKCEPCPGRWTHHFVLSGEEELDGEMLEWIRASYDFAEAKRRRSRIRETKEGSDRA